MRKNKDKFTEMSSQVRYKIKSDLIFEEEDGGVEETGWENWLGPGTWSWSARGMESADGGGPRD